MKRDPNHHSSTTITFIKRLLPLSCMLIAGLVLSGCKPAGEFGAGPSTSAARAAAADLVGEYTLVSVNGQPVPASVTHDGTALQVRSGTFSIKTDGTCSTKTVFVPPSGQEVEREVNATYTKEGSKLTMQWKGAGTTTGTVEGNTFTMNNEGMVFVYRK